MAAANAQAFPPAKNQAYRLYVGFITTAGAPVTSWTGAASSISLDGGAAAAGPVPIEIGTSGIGYMDFSAAQMNAGCVAGHYSVTNTNAVAVLFAIATWNPQDITPNGVWNEQPILRFEEMVKNIVAALYNLNDTSNATGSGVRQVFAWQNPNALVASGPVVVAPNVSVTQGPLQ